MAVTIEFYSVPRLRAGVPRTTTQATQLGEVLRELADRFPALGETCIEGNSLRSGYVASIDGRQFVTDPGTTLAEGETLLILSADAGG